MDQWWSNFWFNFLWSLLRRVTIWNKLHRKFNRNAKFFFRKKMHLHLSSILYKPWYVNCLLEATHTKAISTHKTNDSGHPLIAGCEQIITLLFFNHLLIMSVDNVLVVIDKLIQTIVGRWGPKQLQRNVAIAEFLTPPPPRPTPTPHPRPNVKFLNCSASEKLEFVVV